MAKSGALVPDALLPASSVYAPPPPTAPPWVDHSIYQHPAAEKLPPCTIPIDCSKEANRLATMSNWWLPVGSIVVGFGHFRAYFHVGQLGDLRHRITQTISENAVPIIARVDIRNAWLKTSRQAVSNVLHLRRASAITPAQRLPAHLHPSINDFLKEEPRFALGYLDINLDIQPTASEMTETGGLDHYYDRGGTLIFKPALEGQEPLRRTTLYACAEWCRGCTTVQWTTGVPTCAVKIKIETDNFDWGLFIKRLPGGAYEVSLNRLPKDTWDKIEDGIRTLTDPLDKFMDWMCVQHSTGTDRAVAATVIAVAGANPALLAASITANAVLDSGCPGASSGGTSTISYVPGQTTVPRPRMPAVDVGQMITAQTFAPLEHPKSKVGWVIGLAALGLGAAGVGALVHRRRRSRS